MGLIPAETMDKDRKLKRYGRKDYSEIVDFPVEIVGRDGVVRHYDFEESVRLYQRRFSFAPMRFRDDDLVAAEQGHCKSRIEQLRRSYFHLHGWEPAAQIRGPEGARPDHAGELAAFLQRVFRDPGRLDVQFTSLPREAPGDLWYLSRAGEHAGLLLYVFVFDGAESEGDQLAFVDLLREFRATSECQGDAERVVGYHHATDCAYVLTGRGEEVDELAASVAESSDGGGYQPNAWDEITEFVRRGDLPAAFLRCRSLVEEQPWHRDAYVLGATLGVHLRQPTDAEDLGFVGTRYFPDDALVHTALALSRVHQGRWRDAGPSLDIAVGLQPDLSLATTLQILIDARHGYFLAASRACWRQMGPNRSADDTDLHAVMRFGRRVTVLSWMMALVLVVCAVAAIAGSWVAKIGVGLLLALSIIGYAGARRRAHMLIERLALGDPQATLQRIRRTRSGGRATGT